MSLRALHSAALETNQTRTASAPALPTKRSKEIELAGLDRANSESGIATPSPPPNETISPPGSMATGSSSSSQNVVPAGNPPVVSDRASSTVITQDDTSQAENGQRTTAETVATSREA